VYENTKKCGRKTHRSRQAPRMTWRDVIQRIIKKPSMVKEGESISKGSAMVGTMGEIATKNFWGSLRTSSQAMSGKHYKNIGNCIRRNIMQEVISR
jgi:hypothetical protein